MNHSKYYTTFLIFMLLFIHVTLVAQANDTTKVETFKNLDIVTWYGTHGVHGASHYEEVFAFPKGSENKTYHKAYLTFTIKCHSQGRCGAWDYINHLDILGIYQDVETGDIIHSIHSRKETVQGKIGKNPVMDLPKPVQLLRYIDPYWSPRFVDSSTWGFTWKVDITDFIPFLHDNLHLRYTHTGYEGVSENVRDSEGNPVTRSIGWNLSVDFYLIEGTPIQNFVSVEQLDWRLDAYGVDVSSHNFLLGHEFALQPDAKSIKVKITQTGHGFKTPISSPDEGCAEFCRKSRKIYLDEELLATKDLWSQCAYAPIWGQRGNWARARANWCPGDISLPDDYTVFIEDNNYRTLRMEMEETSVASGSWVINALLFQYGKPNFTQDVSIEDILAPSTDDIHHRYNPICAGAVVVIRNNGSKQLTSARIKYGLESSEEVLAYEWEGELDFMESDTVRLPGVLDWESIGSGKSTTFTAFVTSPNGGRDDYYHNNTYTSTYEKPTHYAGTDITYVLVGNSTSNLENAVRVHDLSDTINNENLLYEKDDFRNNSSHTETFKVKPGGCYRLTVHDDERETTIAEGFHGYKEEEGRIIYGLNYVFDRQNGLSSGSFAINNEEAPALYQDFGGRLIHSFTIEGTRLTPLEQLDLAVDEPIIDKEEKPSFGITDPAAETGILLHPNPAHQHVVMESQSLPIVGFTLLNVLGHTLEEKELSATTSYRYNIEDVHPGVYILRIQLQHGQSVYKRFVIE